MLSCRRLLPSTWFRKKTSGGHTSDDSTTHGLTLLTMRTNIASPKKLGGARWFGVVKRGVKMTRAQKRRCQRRRFRQRAKRARRPRRPLTRLRRKLRRCGKPFRVLDGQYYHPFLKYKFKKSDVTTVRLKNKSLSKTTVDGEGNFPYRLQIKWGRITVNRVPSSFKSSWRKNVRMLGGSVRGHANRELWKIASMITRFGMTQKYFGRIHQAFELLSHGKHMGYSRIVKQLTGGSKIPRSSPSAPRTDG